MLKQGFGLILLGLTVMAHASEDSLWDAEVELGAVFTSGNTDEKNFKFRGEVVRDKDRFKHTAHLDALNSSKNDEKTAQKTYVFYKLDYKLDKGSVFGRVSYEDDKFNGFDYQADFTGGYSRLLMEKSTMSLAGDLGLGYRRSELENGLSEDEIIVRFAATYVWQVSENATFRQMLSTEIGNESTISRSETSLSANVAGNLAMKIALNIRNNSAVPVGREKTDTESSVTLVYTF
jgi:putative salt-induced outer membrane protein